MLLNPIAGNESTFSTLMFRHYDVIPSILNVYIMVDPSKGKTKRSDRTAIAVVGIDVAGNKYLLDGYCHRMKLSRRWELVKQLKKKWDNHQGVQVLRVGYEQYGMQSDLEVVEENMDPREEPLRDRGTEHAAAGQALQERPHQPAGAGLQPRAFYLPAVVYHPDFGGGGQPGALGRLDRRRFKRMEDAGAKDNKPVGTIVYRPMQGPTKQQRYCEATFQAFASSPRSEAARRGRQYVRPHARLYRGSALPPVRAA
jgi:hypothetical protein